MNLSAQQNHFSWKDSITSINLLGTSSDYSSPRKAAPQINFTENIFSSNENILFEMNSFRYDKIRMNLNSDFHYNSNALIVPFVSAIAKNGFIDSPEKLITQQKLKNKNTIDFGSNNEISFQKYQPTGLFKKSLLTFAVKQRSLNSISFSRDAFNILFFGNAMYAGETADLSNCKYGALNFQQYQFGFQKWICNNKHELAVAVSLLNGMSGTSFKTNTATLFTEQFGEYLDLNYDFDLHSTKGKNYFKGVGASSDFSFSGYSNKLKTQWWFFAKDVGFISWNKKSTDATANNFLHFMGVEVENLFAQTDSGFLHIKADSILSLLQIEKQNEAFTSVLPMRIGFAFQNFQHHLAGNISYRPMVDKHPLLFFQYKKRINIHGKRNPTIEAFVQKHLGYNKYFFDFSPSLSFGGTGNLNLGLRLSTTFHGKIYLSLGTFHLQSFFLPEQSTGASVFLQLHCNL